MVAPLVLVEGGVERADIYGFTDSSLEPSRVLIEEFSISEFVTSGSEVLENRRVDVLVYVVSMTDTIRPSCLAYVVFLTVITVHMVDRTTHIFRGILILGRTEELSDGVSWFSMRYDSMLAELPHQNVGESLYVGEGNMASHTGGAFRAGMWNSFVRQ